MEVWMRPPEVFVRELSLDEGNRLKRLSRKAASEVKREHALICWASATKMNPQQIAALVGTDETHVRKVIHAFTSGGSARWTLSHGPGVLAGSPQSSALRVPATRWSLVRLARYLAQQQIVQGSPAHLGRILKARVVVSAHADVEGQPRPRLRAQSSTSAGAVRQGARERGVTACAT